MIRSAWIIFASLVVAFGAITMITARMFGPEACPFGAARTPVGYVCLSERDLEVLAERCYLTEACETPGEHKAHAPNECKLEDARPLP